MSNAFTCDRCETAFIGSPPMNIDGWVNTTAGCDTYELCELCANRFESFMCGVGLNYPVGKRQRNTGSLSEAYKQMNSDE